MTDVVPGYVWCHECADYVSDVFSDHDKHHAQKRKIAEASWSSRDFLFWGFCFLAAGIAAKAVSILLITL